MSLSQFFNALMTLAHDLEAEQRRTWASDLVAEQGTGANV